MNECDYCEELAVFQINGRSACQQHIEDATKGALAPVQQLIRDLNEGDT